MYNRDQSTAELKFVFNESVQIEQVINDTRQFLRDKEMSAPDNLRIVLRELLLNAVNHGNGNDKEKKVDCSFSLQEGSMLKIEVADEGKGFDFKAVLKDQRQSEKTNRSGLGLLNTITEDISFSEGGSKVTALYKLDETGEVFSTTSGEDRLEILPRQDLTAVLADKLRKHLIFHFDKGERNFCFNFLYVQDVDSICLAVLLSFGKMVKNQSEENKLSIVNASQDIHSLFNMIGITEFYTLENVKECIS